MTSMGVNKCKCRVGMDYTAHIYYMCVYIYNKYIGSLLYFQLLGHSNLTFLILTGKENKEGWNLWEVWNPIWSFPQKNH